MLGRKSSKRTWALLLLGTGTAAAVFGCHPTTTPVSVHASVPPECAERDRVQALLIELARRSAELGRLDALVFEPPAPGASGIEREGESLKTLPPERLEGFRRALKNVAVDPAARQALGVNLEAVRRICGADGCPPKIYPIDVSEDATADPALIAYQLKFKEGEAPSPTQLKAFAALYTVRNPSGHECLGPLAVSLAGPTMLLAAFRAGHCADPPPNPEPMEGNSCEPPSPGHWHWGTLPGNHHCWMCSSGN